MNMKFVKGMIAGSLVSAGVIMLWVDSNMGNKKMMKKGRQLAKRMGIM